MKQRLLSPPGLMVYVLLTCMIGVNAHAVSSKQLAVVFNTADPESREIARYYQQQRHIPKGNMVAIKMPLDRARINPEQFKRVYAQVKAATPADVQFYALAWSKPYRVGCMSVTSAFALVLIKNIARWVVWRQRPVRISTAIANNPIRISKFDRR